MKESLMLGIVNHYLEAGTFKIPSVPDESLKKGREALAQMYMTMGIFASYKDALKHVEHMEGIWKKLKEEVLSAKDQKALDEAVRLNKFPPESILCKLLSLTTGHN
jgi:hypothetical protein